jgi:hypothetical protein
MNTESVKACLIGSELVDWGNFEAVVEEDLEGYKQFRASIGVQEA